MSAVCVCMLHECMSATRQCGLHTVFWSHIGKRMCILAAEPRTSPLYMTFISISVSLWNDLSDPVFVGVVPAGFKGRANAAYLLA